MVLSYVLDSTERGGLRHRPRDASAAELQHVKLERTELVGGGTEEHSSLAIDSSTISLTLDTTITTTTVLCTPPAAAAAV